MSDQIAKAVELFNAGKRDAARGLCNQILQRDAGNAEAWHLIGAIAAHEKQHEDAIEYFERALGLRENWPEALCNLAAACRALGQFAKAKQQLYRALECDPRYARAYFFLSQIGSYRDDQLLAKVRAVLRQPPLAFEDQCYLQFAAGKICDDLDRFDEAFHHYALACAARQARFDPVEHAALIRRVMGAFDGGSFGARGDPSRRPIFVVGMPRSGTSLVEQILASHADVHGAGELPDIISIARALPEKSTTGQDYPECIPTLPNAVFEGYAQAYLRRLDQVAPAGSARIVDKNPGNYLHVGLLHLMFPRASIIHCVRNELSTCLSCFFQNFVHQHEYSFDQVHLGCYYVQYERLMAHWFEVLPERVLALSYERLVAEPEAATRELLQWCDLTWDDRCLSPHQTSRPVATASAWEVRQPIYRSSLERWRNYEIYLGPLRNALDRARDEYRSSTRRSFGSHD